MATPALLKEQVCRGCVVVPQGQAGDAPCYKVTERLKGHELGEQNWVHSWLSN